MNEDFYIIWKESFQKASNNATRNWQTTYAVLKLPEVINGFYDTMTDTFDNGDTRKELLARSRYVLYKSSEKWTLSQRERAEIMFREYPDIERAYQLAQHLRTVFNKRSQKSAARLNLARWYDQVEKAGFDSFQTLAGTIYDRYDEVLNYFNDRSTNASAEAFNSKVKNFRAALRGVSDVSFFLFRLQKIYA